MTKRLRSILSVVLAMAMIFAMATTAFAANSDPNLSVYGNTEFTATVDASSAAQSVTLQVVPADAYYSPSYFTTQAAAEAVTFTPVAGGSFIPTVAATQAVGSNGQYAASAVVTVPQGSAGTVSILVSNPAGGSTATMNLTIVADTTMPAATGVSEVFYDANGNKLAETTNMTVSFNDFYSSPNYNFPTAIDAVYQAWVNGLGQTDCLKDYDMDYGYVSSLTFAQGSEDVVLAEKTEVVGNEYIYYGWQYRIYRDNQLLPISEVVGADTIALQNNDTVVWKYGIYGEVTFANSLG